MKKLRVFRSLWGLEVPWWQQATSTASREPRNVLAYLSAQGYDGVEASLTDLDVLCQNIFGGPLDRYQKSLQDELRAQNLELIVGGQSCACVLAAQLM